MQQLRQRQLQQRNWVGLLRRLRPRALQRWIGWLVH
jgi:hypothetical protein